MDKLLLIIFIGILLIFVVLMGLQVKKLNQIESCQDAQIQLADLQVQYLQNISTEMDNDVFYKMTQDFLQHSKDLQRDCI